MKVYVVSDNEALAASAVNAINGQGHTAILSEAGAETDGAIMGDIKANMRSGFDLILVICANAKSVSISANKIGGAMAVVCKDQDDAVEAMSQAGANVVLLDSTRTDRKILSGIVDGLLSGQEAETKVPSRARAVTPQRAHPPTQGHARAQQAQPVHEAPAGPSKFGSFLSSIKDAASSATSGISNAASTISKPGPAPKAQKPVVKAAPRPQPSGGDGIVSSLKKKGLAQTIKETFGIED